MMHLLDTFKIPQRVFIRLKPIHAVKLLAKRSSSQDFVRSLLFLIFIGWVSAIAAQSYRSPLVVSAPQELQMLSGQARIDSIPKLNTPFDDFVVCSIADHLYLLSNVHRSRRGQAIPSKSDEHKFELSRVKKPQALSPQSVKILLRSSRLVFGSKLQEMGCAFDSEGNLRFVTEMRSFEGAKVASSEPLRPQIVEAQGTADYDVNRLSALVNRCPLACTNFHPTMDPERKIVVFATNRENPEVEGEKPINHGSELFYSCHYQGKWQSPIALPNYINSLGDEVLPSFGPNGQLFFASNRGSGCGGYDLYMTIVDLSKIDKREAPGFGPLLHLPLGINSRADDLGFVWSFGQDSSRSAFFSSDRRVPGNLDIYRIKMQFTTIQGRLVSSADGSPLAHTPMTMSDVGGANPIVVTTDDHGAFAYIASTNKPMEIHSDLFGELRLQLSAIKNSTSILGANLGTLPVDLQAMSGQVYISGNVLDEFGKPLDAVQVKVFHVDSSASNPPINLQRGHYKGMVITTGDFYIDFLADNYEKTTIHYHEQDFRSGDTLSETVQLSRGHGNIYTAKVRDADTKGVVSFPVVKLIRFEGESKISETIAVEVGDSTGLFRIAIPDSHANCSLIVAPDGYLPIVLDLKRDSIGKVFDCIAAASLYKESLKIFHPYGKPAPEVVSRRELEQISQFLLNNSDAHILVVSHTDCRGSDSYNLLLSRQRAQSVADYIVSRTAIDRLRITQVGKGETQLLEKSCNCQGVDTCDEALHGRNRRTEITLRSE